MSDQQPEPDVFAAIDQVLAEHDTALDSYRAARDALLRAETDRIQLGELSNAILTALLRGEDATALRTRRNALLAAADAAMDRVKACEAHLAQTALRRNQVAEIVGFPQPGEWQEPDGDGLTDD